MKETDITLCMGCMNPDAGVNTCPNCGFDKTAAINQDYIAHGEHLDSRYIVGELQKYNGEGATYLGYDLDKKNPVWIREYFPNNISTRSSESNEIVPNAGSGAQYKALMSDFVELCNEVRRLGITEPVIPVENMVGENNTIYIIYKHLEVMQLEEYITARGGKLSYQDTLELLIPLLNCVDNIHMTGLIHRGLSPYTILIDQQGKLYLDGFSLGATRTGGSELTAEFFNGYSAPEQYVSTGWQGTWTDVYALATLLYRTISGVVPPKSTRISDQRPLTPLKSLVSGVPDNISNAVARGMKILSQERTQTVGALLAEMLSEGNVESTAVFELGRMPVNIPVENTFTSSRGMQENYGETEEINTPLDFQEFRKDFRNSQQKPEPVVRPNYNQPTYDNEYYDYDPQSRPPVPPPKDPKLKYILLGILLLVILLGAILAVVISGKLNLNTKPKPAESTPQTSQEVSVDSSNIGPSTSSESSDSSDTSSKVDELVPNFIGRERAVVEYHKDYVDRYTFVVKEEYSDKWDKGIIAEQSVREGSKMPNKGTIVLTVSKGPHAMKMPQLVGLEYEAALQELAKVALELEMTIEDLTILEPISKIDVVAVEGTVLSTNPVADAEFNPKTDKIQLTVAVPPPVSVSPKSSPPPSTPPSSKPDSSTSSSGETPDIGPNRPKS